MSILIVEDNPISAKLMVHSLEKLNYQTLIASIGKEALDVLTENASINLVVTDVMMPVMDGLELVERNKYSYAHMPVIVCTDNLELNQSISKEMNKVINALSK